MKRTKLVIIGAGQVGASLAYTLFTRNEVDIYLIDNNLNKLKGQVLDMAHAEYISNSTIHFGTYKDCKDADFIVITASVPGGKELTSRNQLLQGNLELLSSILKEIKANFNPLAKFILISNPVDALSYFTYSYLNIPNENVIGSGTYLDSLRFRYYLAKELNIPTKDVNGYVIGEHGDSEVLLFSSVNIKSTPLDEYLEKYKIKLDKDKIKKDTIEGGFYVTRAKGYTNYAIAMAVSEIINALTSKIGNILPISNYSDKYKVYMSLPYLLTQNGVSKRLDLELSSKEKEDLEKSIDALKNNQKIVDKFIKTLE